MNHQAQILSFEIPQLNWPMMIHIDDFKFGKLKKNQSKLDLN
jgi:hypothetical protein